MLVALPTIWHDVGGGRHSLEDLLRELEEDFPDLATDRDRLRDALDLPATASEQARERLLALPAETRSAEMPRARFDDEPDSEYEPYWA
ncbi:hypothetical protein ACFOJ6_10110 [Gordonia humi]|uniref:hypothetical protein n=1 Tax=Gordonia humi TaxID=686429 RepID=UPI003612C91C